MDEIKVFTEINVATVLAREDVLYFKERSVLDLFGQHATFCISFEII